MPTPSKIIRTVEPETAKAISDRAAVIQMREREINWAQAFCRAVEDLYLTTDLLDGWLQHAQRDDDLPRPPRGGTGTSGAPPLIVEVDLSQRTAELLATLLRPVIRPWDDADKPDPEHDGP